VNQGMETIRENWAQSRDRPAADIQGLVLIIAFIGCSELPSSAADGLAHFLYFTRAVVTELFAALDQKAHPSVWCSLAAGLQSAARHFNDACLAKGADRNQSFVAEEWTSAITQRYPDLQTIGAGNDSSSMALEQPPTSAETPVTVIRNDFLLISLYLVKQLYQRATKQSTTGTKDSGLVLGGDFSGDDVASEYQYLHVISGFAGFVIRELTEDQQQSLQIEKHVVDLFQSELVSVTDVDESTSWEWLVQGNVSVLCLGILESLRASGVARLFDSQVARGFLSSGAFPSSVGNATTGPVTQSILTILANKYKIETSPALMAKLHQNLSHILSKIQSGDADSSVLDEITPFYSIVNGMLRRGSGKDAKQLVELLREGPQNSSIGHHLGRRFEMLVAPQSYLTKDNFAVVKPLWIQKVYFELVKPMLQKADGSDASAVEPVKTNHGIAVLSMLKHMDFAIFEDDSTSIIRVCILIAQNTGAGPDTETALKIIRGILPEAPEKLKGHLRSLVKICIQAFSSRARDAYKRPDWMPSDYEALARDPRAAAACGKLGLDILGAMPQIFDAADVSSFAPQVGRELTVACGHQVRDLRKAARLARTAWASLK
jgi:DNA repair/transcription protein MET18/MMS19